MEKNEEKISNANKFDDQNLKRKEIKSKILVTKFEIQNQKQKVENLKKEKKVLIEESNNFFTKWLTLRNLNNEFMIDITDFEGNILQDENENDNKNDNLEKKDSSLKYFQNFEKEKLNDEKLVDYYIKSIIEKKIKILKTKKLIDLKNSQSLKIKKKKELIEQILENFKKKIEEDLNEIQKKRIESENNIKLQRQEMIEFKKENENQKKIIDNMTHLINSQKLRTDRELQNHGKSLLK
jgi:hypothetical protein